MKHFFFLLCLLSSKVFAQAESPERLLNFADQLFHRGEYYRAITEYLRFESYFPQDPRASDVPLRIGMAYMYGGKTEEALQALQRALLSKEPAIQAQAHYLQGRIYYTAEHYPEAFKSWQNIEHFPEANLARRYTLFALLKLGKTEQALNFLRMDGQAGLMEAQAIHLAKKLAETPKPSTRSAKTAAILSALLPGSGHLYAKHPRDALVSFLINGLFIFGTVEAFRSGNAATGVLFGSIEAGWYAGNIVSAANAANRYNLVERDRWLENVANLSALEKKSRQDESSLFFKIKIDF